MISLVLTMENMRLPIVDEYGTQDMLVLSTFVLGHYSKDILKCVGRGAPNWFYIMHIEVLQNNS